MMAVETKNFDRLLSQTVQPSQKQIIKMFQAQVMQVRQKWMQQFQRSIQLWMQYIILRIQTIKSQLRLVANCKQNNQNILKLKQQISLFIFESQNSVSKALKNVQKLYMTPELKINSQSRQKKQVKLSSDSKIIGKSRSASLGSPGRSRRSSIFSSIKTKIGETKNKFKVQQNFNSVTNSVSNSNISKHYRPKPKYDNSIISMGPNCLQLQTKQNFNDSVPEAVSKQFLNSFLNNKQKGQQKKLIQQFSQKIQQRLSIIQSDINQKLNMIITNINKSHNNTTRTNQNKEVPNDYKQTKQLQSTKITKNECLKQEIHRESIKKNSIIKKIRSNPIVDEEDMIEKLQFPQNQQKSNVQIKGFQKNLEQFFSTAKKIKLPISQTLIKVFTSFYLARCSQLSTYPNSQKIQITKCQPFNKENEQKLKNQLKQCLAKLKRLLTMDGLNDKAQKIKIYVLQCLHCCYDLVIKSQWKMQESIQVQIDKIMVML